MKPAYATATGPAPAAHPLMRFLQGSRKDGTEDWTPADIWVLRRSDLKAFTLSLTGAGFLTYIFVILTFRIDVGDVAVAMALVGILFQGGKVVAPPFIIVLSLFVAWCALGLLTTPYPFVSQRETILLSKLLLIWFAALNALRTRSQLRFFLLFCVFLYCTHPVRGALFNWLIYRNTPWGRVVWQGVFGNSNGLAALTILYLSMAAAILVSEKKGIYKLGAQAAVVVLPILIFLTQSRGGLLGMVAFAGLAFTGQRKKARMLLLAAVIAVGSVAFVPSSAWSRLGQLASIGRGGTSTLEGLDDMGSARERWEIMRVASKVISHYPITGVGWGAYPRVHYDYILRYRSEFTWFTGDRVKPMDAHNTYIAILVETGFIGFTMFFLAIGMVLTRAERIRRRWAAVAPNAARQIALLEMGFAGFMVSALFATLAHHAYFYVHLTVIWVSAEMLERDMRELARASARNGPGAAMMPGPPGPGPGVAGPGPGPAPAPPGV